MEVRMPASKRSGSKDRPITVALISAAAVIIAAFISVVGTGHAPWQHPCAAKLQITAPRDGTTVGNGLNGLTITGKACNLNGDQGWLFDQDLMDGKYYEDYNDDNPGPVAVHNGTWTFTDKPIGNPGDFHTRYIVTLVDSSQSCSNSLLAGGPEADYSWPRLPEGCRIADSIDVYVNSYGD